MKNGPSGRWNMAKGVSAMKEVTDKDFDREVLKSKLPVFACFTTKWSHSCYPTCLFAAELTEEYNDRVKFVRVDIEESPEIAERYHVIPVPTILLFRDSQLLKRLLGFQDRISLRSVLNSVTAEKGLSY
jgi:thioredoxin 1